MTQTSQPPGDAASVTMLVEVEPSVAFEVFTKEIDLWWRRGVRYRIAGRRPGVMHLEPRLGGRVFESIEGSAALYQVGLITSWEPPRHLVFEWRNVNFTEGEKTEVEIFFDATARGTNVRLIHRGWSKIRADHPARHGMESADFLRSLGLWWGGLLSSYLERALSSGQ